MFTVKQLSKLAGVTPRTLHHYDAIGLLKPSRIGANGYRYYEQESLLRLQQILFYRELDIPLDEIRKIMGRPDFDVLEALQGHKQALNQDVNRLSRLIATVDTTILHLKGLSTMSDQEYFRGFTPEEEEKYTEEAAQMYDPATVKASAKKWKSYTPAEKKNIGGEGNAVYSELLAAMSKGAGSVEAQSAVEHWHRHIQYFWTPDDDQLLGLADLYNDDPRFRGNFDKISPGLAGFIREAVKAYVQKRKSGG
jgi:MerR family transcriptional regulator, thiopeptide resistance regulator